MSIAGHATTEGTARFATRFPEAAAQAFYRKASSLSVSSLGIGSYLGEPNSATDGGYEDAIGAALEGGINFIDTSLNYREQRSERAIGRALAAGPRRDEYVVGTKAGYLIRGAVPALAREDVVGGIHSMAPAFLLDQLARSLENLRLEAIDILYLHNPETQLDYVDEDEFYSRVRTAFECLESAVSAGSIRGYGAATWNGFRDSTLSLTRMVSMAHSVGGDGHHFRWIQLPFNLAMTEAISRPAEDGQTMLELADSFGLNVVASASLLQARLAADLPAIMDSKIGGLRTSAQRAIQYARSAPGIKVALAGMSQVAHVAENLGIAGVHPLTRDAFATVLR
ncbi:MAG: aldo/keto reductase [Bryobacteraceae bacterium]